MTKQPRSEAGCSPVPLDPLVGPDTAFESWYTSRGLSEWSHWHPERGGYTYASTKQLCWETWQAAIKSMTPNEKLTGAGFMASR